MLKQIGLNQKPCVAQHVNWTRENGNILRSRLVNDAQFWSRKIQIIHKLRHIVDINHGVQISQVKKIYSRYESHSYKSKDSLL